jgi:hypothetical protein
MIRANAQNGHINGRIASHQTSIKRPPIGQRNANATSMLNNVGIGKDLTIRGKNEAGTEATTAWRGTTASTSLPTLNIDADNCGANAFSRLRHGMRIGI